jgi:hypothetical protein
MSDFRQRFALQVELLDTSPASPQSTIPKRVLNLLVRGKHGR